MVEGKCYLETLNIYLVSILFCLLPNLSNADPSSYLSDLQQQAVDLKLSEQRHWHVLLHYSPRYFRSGVSSLVDDPVFFFHAQGKYQPQAELSATLASLFQPSGKDANASSQCLFPARFAWLVKQLSIDLSRLPKQHCDQLEYWLQKLAVTELSLIFPVAYLNNPASMFGHTFLRLDSRSKNKQADLLAWTVNYAASTAQEKGISFAFKGLFGGYPGKFSLAPYYFQVKGYGDIENRDIWEYQLNFTATEIKAMLLHLWELIPVYFDYYFIDENCSFQLLSLLEAARPALVLSELFQRDAIPADTVRAIVAVPGLLKSSHFRPSRSTVLLARARQMNIQDQQLAKALIEENSDIKNNSQLLILPAERQAQVLELAFEYYSYLEVGLFGEQLTEKKQQQSYELLKARNALAVDSQAPEIVPPIIRPDQGHLGNRISLAYGYEEPKQYLDVEFRWAYHDFYDPEGGFIDGAKLEFFKPSIRYYPQRNKVQFEAIDLVNITSTPIRNRLIAPFSWQASAAVNRQRFDDFDRPLMGSFQAGGGVSYELPTESKVSVFAIGAIHISDRFNQYIAIGGGAELHFRHDLSNAWRIGAEAKVVQYFQGISHTTYQISLQQRYSINQENALVMRLKHKNEFSRKGFFVGELNWRYYF
jgi:hypothetical protein